MAKLPADLEQLETELMVLEEDAIALLSSLVSVIFIRARACACVCVGGGGGGGGGGVHTMRSLCR